MKAKADESSEKTEATTGLPIVAVETVVSFTLSALSLGSLNTIAETTVSVWSDAVFFSEIAEGGAFFSAEGECWTEATVSAIKGSFCDGTETRLFFSLEIINDAPCKRNDGHLSPKIIDIIFYAIIGVKKSSDRSFGLYTWGKAGKKEGRT